MKVMFSAMPVSMFIRGLGGVPMWPLPMMHWTSLYRTTPLYWALAPVPCFLGECFLAVGSISVIVTKTNGKSRGYWIKLLSPDKLDPPLFQKPFHLVLSLMAQLKIFSKTDLELVSFRSKWKQIKWRILVRNQCKDIDGMLNEASIVKASRILFHCIVKPPPIYGYILKHYITVDI